MRRLYTTLLTGACLAAIVTGCGSGTDSSRIPQSGANTVARDERSFAHVQVPARWASANARDPRTLVHVTGTVFVGEVIAFSGQRHESLDSNSGGANTAASADGKPAPRRLAAFPISIYEVSVERVLAGALDQGSTAILEQPGGLVSMADGSQTVIMLEGDDPLEVGGRYLFFASVKPGGALTAAPFARFTVASDGSIEPTEAWAGLPAARILAGLTIDEAAREIEAVAD